MIGPVLLGTQTRSLDFSHSAARTSRRLVAEALAAWKLDLDVDAVQSCTSELVTDALRHGDRPLHLVIQHWTDCVQVMVINGGQLHGRRRTTPYNRASVRQRIVEGLATGWGVESLPSGTAAWFDVETQPLVARWPRGHHRMGSSRRPVEGSAPGLPTAQH